MQSSNNAIVPGQGKNSEFDIPRELLSMLSSRTSEQIRIEQLNRQRSNVSHLLDPIRIGSVWKNRKTVARKNTTDITHVVVTRVEHHDYEDHIHYTAYRGMNKVYDEWDSDAIFRQAFTH